MGWEETHLEHKSIRRMFSIKLWRTCSLFSRKL